MRSGREITGDTYLSRDFHLTILGFSRLLASHGQASARTRLRISFCIDCGLIRPKGMQRHNLPNRQFEGIWPCSPRRRPSVVSQHTRGWYKCDSRRILSQWCPTGMVAPYRVCAVSLKCSDLNSSVIAWLRYRGLARDSDSWLGRFLRFPGMLLSFGTHRGTQSEN